MLVALLHPQSWCPRVTCGLTGCDCPYEFVSSSSQLPWLTRVRLIKLDFRLDPFIRQANKTAVHRFRKQSLSTQQLSAVCPFCTVQAVPHASGSSLRACSACCKDAKDILRLLSLFTSGRQLQQCSHSFASLICLCPSCPCILQSPLPGCCGRPTVPCFSHMCIHWAVILTLFAAELLP